MTITKAKTEASETLKSIDILKLHNLFIIIFISYTLVSEGFQGLKTKVKTKAKCWSGTGPIRWEL